MTFVESPTTFYVGKRSDPDTLQLTNEVVYYDSRDLTAHALVLGMTGSGKSGLCTALLEEAVLDNIPSIVIDPKGDITNLLLTFPDMKPQDFEPWINIDEVQRARKDIPQYVAEVATTWKAGQADWGIVSDRLRWLKLAAKYSIYTPGSDAGLPINILPLLEAPAAGVIGKREQINSIAKALLGLVGLDVEPLRDKEHVLVANIIEYAWQRGVNLTPDDIIMQVATPPFDKLGVLSIDSYMSQKARQKLAMKLNNLIVTPSFQTWVQGQPLDIPSLLYQPNGRPRVSIFYLAHLGVAERAFIITLILEGLLKWMQTTTGTAQLRALLYVDEMSGMLPPDPSNPPTKQPMIQLLNQAHAYGLGMILATQNPADLDFKRLANTGTWFFGRLSSENDQQRLLQGLHELAWDELQLDEIKRLVSKLESRQFLVRNNRKQSGPLLLHTRSTMSYLRGPLTRHQISSLMREQYQELVAQFGIQKPVVQPPQPAQEQSAIPQPPPKLPETQDMPAVKAGVDTTAEHQDATASAPPPPETAPETETSTAPVEPHDATASAPPPPATSSEKETSTAPVEPHDATASAPPPPATSSEKETSTADAEHHDTTADALPSPETKTSTPDGAPPPKSEQDWLKLPLPPQTSEPSAQGQAEGAPASAQTADAPAEGAPSTTQVPDSNKLATIVRTLNLSPGAIIFLIFLGSFGAGAISLIGNMNWSSSGTSSSGGNVDTFSFPLGYGASKGFWNVYFTAPSGSSDYATYHDGIDTYLADAINNTTSTLDIAAFEFNNEVLTQAILDAYERGVSVRIVTDDEYGVADEETTTNQFIDAGIPLVDDDRSALMHNKYMILDGAVVWTGAWNYTINGTYRNNNNAVSIESPDMVTHYQTDFNAMFEDGLFNSSKPSEPDPTVVQDGTTMQVYFSPNDDVSPAIIETIQAAQETVDFMAYSFTLDDVGQAIKERADAGVEVRGIFELTGSETEYSELPPLFCDGLAIMQDGNSYVMHHKVFIVDNKTVITGSFNFSASAEDDNNENLLIVEDPDLAAQFTAEFERRWAEAEAPDPSLCVY